MIELPRILSQHETEDEPLTHRLTMGALAALEDQFGLSSAMSVLETPAASHLGYLGWWVRKRQGQNVPPFEQWLDGLLIVTAADDEGEDAAGPTEADPEG